MRGVKFSERTCSPEVKWACIRTNGGAKTPSCNIFHGDMTDILNAKRHIAIPFRWHSQLTITVWSKSIYQSRICQDQRMVVSWRNHLNHVVKVRNQTWLEFIFLVLNSELAKFIWPTRVHSSNSVQKKCVPFSSRDKSYWCIFTFNRKNNLTRSKLVARDLWNA